MIYPDLRRLSLACPTGMMQAAAPAAPAAPAPAAGPPNVVTIWNGLTPQQQQAVIDLLQLDKQRKINDAYAATTAAKTLVIKGTRNNEALLPAELRNRAWKGQPWQVVLNGPAHRYLFEEPEGPGFDGHQIGEDEPNQAKDYGRHLVYNPYGGWEKPRYYNKPTTGVVPASLSEQDAEARWAWERLNGATPASQDQEARRAWEALDRLNDMTPPDDADVPPAPPPPEQQPELNAWNNLPAGNAQNIVLAILAEQKTLREWRAGYRGHPPQTPDRVAKEVEFLTAQLPPALNTPAKFNSVNWELALEGKPEYDYVFGLGNYQSD